MTLPFSMCTSGKVQLWVSTEQKNRIQRTTRTFYAFRIWTHPQEDDGRDHGRYGGVVRWSQHKFSGFYSIFSGVFLGISVLSLAEILFWFLKAFTGVWRCQPFVLIIFILRQSVLLMNRWSQELWRQAENLAETFLRFIIATHTLDVNTLK